MVLCCYFSSSKVGSVSSFKATIPFLFSTVVVWQVTWCDKCLNACMVYFPSNFSCLALLVYYPHIWTIYAINYHFLKGGIANWFMIVLCYISLSLFAFDEILDFYFQFHIFKYNIIKRIKNNNNHNIHKQQIKDIFSKRKRKIQSGDHQSHWPIIEIA